MFFFFFRDKTGKFPDYPDDDEGGSAAIFKEKDPGEVSGILNCFFCETINNNMILLTYQLTDLTTYSAFIHSVT